MQKQINRSSLVIQFNRGRLVWAWAQNCVWGSRSLTERAILRGVHVLDSLYVYV